MRPVWLTLVALLANAAAVAQTDSPTAGDPAMESVLQRLASFRTLRGDFVQSREIAGLSRPLVSSGRFLISELGLFWGQSEPFESTLIAREDSLTQQIGDRAPVTITLEDQPIAVSIGRVFLGLFQGNRDRLSEHFDVAFEQREARWRLELDPITFPLTESVERIVVEGNRHLERIRIDGIAEDVMTIDLSNQSAEPAALTEVERELYSP